MRLAVQTIIQNVGTPVVLKYFTPVINGSYYDNPASLTLSGTVWTSGYRETFGKGDDPFMDEQGLLLQRDSKLWLPGNIDTSGCIKVGIGSPAAQFFSTIQIGPQGPVFTESPAFKIVTLRWLPTGSLVGE